MEVLVYALIVIAVLLSLQIMHYEGYKKGHKQGFELGREKINEYALKINEAQGERIKQLQEEINQGRTDDIKRLADFFTKDVEN